MRSSTSSKRYASAMTRSKPGRSALFKKIRIKNLKYFNRSNFLNINHDTNLIEPKDVNEISMANKLHETKRIFEKNRSDIIQRFQSEMNDSFLCNAENLRNFYR